MFPYHSEYFPHALNLEQHFCSSAFVDKIIRGNIPVLYSLFHQFVVNMGKYIHAIIFLDKSRTIDFIFRDLR